MSDRRATNELRAQEVFHDPDVRFSLANERTMLAWGRTAIALMATGLLVAKVFEGTVLATGFGFGMVVAGVGLAVRSYSVYRRVDRAIRLGEPVPPTSLPQLFVIVIVGAGAAASGLIAWMR